MMDEKFWRLARFIAPALVMVFAVTALRLFRYDDYFISSYISIFFIAAFGIVGMWIAENPQSFFIFSLRLLSILLFLSIFSAFVMALLFPEYMLGPDASERKEIQIFACVASAGTMGGVMRYLMEEKVQNGSSIDLWLLSHSAVSGLFVSVILFLVLRAGVINKVQVDTFNLYGVSGVSAVVGFFADKMVKRFSGLYEEVVGRPKNDS